MFVYFAAAVCVILIVALGRLLVDYSKQADQLSTAVRAHRRLVDEHRRETAQTQARAQVARREIHALIAVSSELDRQIHERLVALEDVQDQLERRRPKARRVDKDGEEGLL